MTTSTRPFASFEQKSRLPSKLRRAHVPDYGTNRTNLYPTSTLFGYCNQHLCPQVRLHVQKVVKPMDVFVWTAPRPPYGHLGH